MSKYWKEAVEIAVGELAIALTEATLSGLTGYMKNASEIWRMDAKLRALGDSDLMELENSTHKDFWKEAVEIAVGEFGIDLSSATLSKLAGYMKNAAEMESEACGYQNIPNSLKNEGDT